MRRIAKPLLVPFLAAAVTAGGAVAATGQSASFGPPVKDCSKLKRAAKTACQKQNANVRTVFGQIKNARFTGTLFNGTSIDALFCANGRWSIDVGVPGLEPKTHTGRRWKLVDPYVAPNRRYISGTAEGSRSNIFTQVHLQRRGAKWYMFRGNPASSAPLATRRAAAADCRAL